MRPLATEANELEKKELFEDEKREKKIKQDMILSALYRDALPLSRVIKEDLTYWLWRFFGSIGNRPVGRHERRDQT